MCECQRVRKNEREGYRQNMIEGEWTGLPLGLLNGQSSQISLPEIKWFGHFAMFWPFCMLKKIVHFKAYFGRVRLKIAMFSEILTFNPVFHFAFFADLSLLKLSISKFGLLNFFWPGNPECEGNREFVPSVSAPTLIGKILCLFGLTLKHFLSSSLLLINILTQCFSTFFVFLVYDKKYLAAPLNG